MRPCGSWLAIVMLSAFTARPIVELKQRDKSKIECILAYGRSYALIVRVSGADAL